MKYFELRKFILETMVMREVYQPVMLLALLKSQGECSEEEIAQEIAEAIHVDRRKPIKHYEERTRKTVGKALYRHKIVAREGKTYRLIDYQLLTVDQINSLIRSCKQKLAEYLQN